MFVLSYSDWISVGSLTKADEHDTHVCFWSKGLIVIFLFTIEYETDLAFRDALYQVEEIPFAD